MNCTCFTVPELQHLAAIGSTPFHHPTCPAYIRPDFGPNYATLQQHISELEKSLENARQERDESLTIQATLRSALMSAKGCLAEYSEHGRKALGAAWTDTPHDIILITNARDEALDERNLLRDQISSAARQCEALRSERDNHQQSAETWRKRVGQAAEALADVLPGEVGRLDLLARISVLKGQLLTAQVERDGARADLARLKPSGQVAEDAEEVEKALEDLMVLKKDLRSKMARDLARRLAAKAQGYEAAILAWDDAARVSDAIARMRGPVSADERRHEMRPPTPGERLLQKYWEMYHAVENERDVAVADNAALVEFCRTERQMLALLYHRIKTLGVHDATDAMTDAVTTVERWMDAVPDTYEQPHPGIALLERIKRLEEQVRDLTLHGEGREAELIEWQQAMGTNLPDVAAAWGRGALNEGLERAAALVEARSTWPSHDRRGALAAEIRALKIPVDDGH